MGYVILIGLLVVFVVLTVMSRRRTQALRDEADMRLYEDTDEFFSKKKLFNQGQKPGELDNSVEVIKYKAREKGEANDRENE